MLLIGSKAGLLPLLDCDSVAYRAGGDVLLARNSAIRRSASPGCIGGKVLHRCRCAWASGVSAPMKSSDLLVAAGSCGWVCITTPLPAGRRPFDEWLCTDPEGSVILSLQRTAIYVESRPDGCYAALLRGFSTPCGGTRKATISRFQPLIATTAMVRSTSSCSENSARAAS